MPETLNLTSADGTALHGLRWTPEGDVKGDIILSHGGGEHIARYDWVAQQLNAHGYRVTGIDLRGHGRSDGRRWHVDSWRNYREDFAAAVAQVDGEFYILAHSMGCPVALDWLRTGSCKGIVMSAPFLGVGVPAPGWKLFAGRVLSRVIPTLSLGNDLSPDMVSRDPDIVAAYATDPLVLDKVTARWFTEWAKAAERCLEHGPRYPQPMLLLWGTGDKIVAQDKIGEIGESWGKSSGAPCEIKKYEGLYHELLNEPEKDQVMGDVLAWLEAQEAAA